MKSRILSPYVLITLGLFLLAFLAVSFRVFLPYQDIFSAVGIKFSAIDAYYQMRIVDSLSYNFPHLYSFDPYFIFPGGGSVNDVHFFNWLVAGIIWLFSFGSPSAHLTDVVGVYFPAILAGLVVFPVYFIGRALFNTWTGLTAALLIAILPGEYLGRSILGFTDTHIAEVLFSTTSVMFLILAIKAARQRGLTFAHLVRRDWPVIRRPLVYAVLSGVFSGIYLVSWQGAVLFTFIMALYFIVQFVIDYYLKRSTDYLSVVTFVALLVAFLIFFRFSPHVLYTLPLFAAMFVPVVFNALAWGIRSFRLKPLWFAASLVGTAVIAVAALAIASPDLFRGLLGELAIFHPSGASAATTMEMQPFLAPGGQVTTAVAWGNFTTSFFLISSSLDPATLWWFPGFGLFSIIIGIWLWVIWNDKPERQRLLYLLLGALVVITVILWFVTPASWKLWFPGISFFSLIMIVILAFRSRKLEPSVLLLCLWTLTILFATIGQRRFAYYLAVNIALLSAFALWLLVWYAGLRKIIARSADADEPKNGKKARPARRIGITIYHVNVVLAVLVGFFFVVFPNIGKARIAAASNFAPTDAWQEALVWMRDNTPEPFGDAQDYYTIFEKTPGVQFKYPETAYGVLSWWDYGYWITRIARRIPISNPSQITITQQQTAYLLTAQEYQLDPTALRMVTWNSALILPPELESYLDDVLTTYNLLQRLRPEYLITDYQTSTSKFWAVLTWADKPRGDYQDIYYYPYEGNLVPVQLYFPAYFQTLVVRLYNFHGEAVTGGQCFVVKYSSLSGGGRTIRRIDDALEFSSYAEAQSYIEEQPDGNYIIASQDPFVSPISMPAVREYEMVYGSSQQITTEFVGGIPEVAVFKRSPE